MGAVLLTWNPALRGVHEAVLMAMSVGTVKVTELPATRCWVLLQFVLGFSTVTSASFSPAATMVMILLLGNIPNLYSCGCHMNDTQKSSPSDTGCGQSARGAS